MTTRTPPALRPAAAPAGKGLDPHPAVRREIDRGLAPLHRAAEAMGYALFDGDRQENEHDLAVMLAVGDLSRLTLEFIDAGRTVVAALSARFVAGRAVADDAELPLLDRRRIARRRFTTSRPSGPICYAALLRANWTAAPTLARASGTTLDRKRHHGVQAEVFVGDDSRRELRVVQAGPKFAFAEGDGLPGRVFLHPEHSQGRRLFAVGERVTAVVVVTPDGTQGRDVRPVAAAPAGRP